MSQITEDTTFKKAVTVNGAFSLAGTASGIPRNGMTVDTDAINEIDWEKWRRIVANDHTQILPAAGTSTFLGIDGGVVATSHPTLQTGDLKAAGATTRSARCTFRLPPSYVAAGGVKLRVKAGMLTTISDTTATVDFRVYKCDDDNTVSADLCATAAQSINSLVLTDKDFNITATTLVPGDLLDIVIDVAINDGATATAVEGIVSMVQALLSIQG